jgi:hypothetical protein
MTSPGLSVANRPPLAQWLASCENREETCRAHTESARSMSAIARELGWSVSRMSRLIAGADRAKDKAGRRSRFPWVEAPTDTAADKPAVRGSGKRSAPDISAGQKECLTPRCELSLRGRPSSFHPYRHFVGHCSVRKRC